MKYKIKALRHNNGETGYLEGGLKLHVMYILVAGLYVVFKLRYGIPPWN
jgi:hypothetical protein